MPAARRSPPGARPRAPAAWPRRSRSWRGDALEGLDEPGLAPFRARLDELRLVVHELWDDARLETGHSGTLLPELTLLAQRHPLRERLQEQLMLALYRNGRQAEALGVFRRLRDRLNDELGLEPRARVRRLEQAILRQDAELEASPRRRAPRPSSPPGRGPPASRRCSRRWPAQTSGELILLTPVAGPRRARGGVGAARAATARTSPRRGVRQPRRRCATSCALPPTRTRSSSCSRRPQPR